MVCCRFYFDWDNLIVLINRAIYFIGITIEPEIHSVVLLFVMNSLQQFNNYPIGCFVSDGNNIM